MWKSFYVHFIDSGKAYDNVAQSTGNWLVSMHLLVVIYHCAIVAWFHCVLDKAILTTGLEDLQIEQKLEANLFNQCKLINYKYSMVYMIPPYIGR